MPPLTNATTDQCHPPPGTELAEKTQALLNSASNDTNDTNDTNQQQQQQQQQLLLASTARVAEIDRLREVLKQNLRGARETAVQEIDNAATTAVKKHEKHEEERVVDLESQVVHLTQENKNVSDMLDDLMQVK